MPRIWRTLYLSRKHPCALAMQYLRLPGPDFLSKCTLRCKVPRKLEHASPLEKVLGESAS